MERNYWMVATGDQSRSYSEVFLRFGVLLLGSGNPGPFKGHENWYRENPSEKYVAWLGEEMQIRDRVILRDPHERKLVAVGEVSGDIDWKENFEDVEGWDIQHCRQVSWKVARTKREAPRRGMRLNKVQDPALIEWADKTWEEGKIRPAQELTPLPAEVSDEELVQHLISIGLRVTDAEVVTGTIRRVRRLATWYRDNGQDISEHETRTFLIVPLLLALGWPEQRIKIEWDRLDIALFRHPYCKYDEQGNPCIMILESKRLWDGLLFAEGQAQSASKEFPSCSEIVISDGICYRLYRKGSKGWDWKAYVNISTMRNRHPYYGEIGGALDIFTTLLPK
jgi:hypothetical protein